MTVMTFADIDKRKEELLCAMQKIVDRLSPRIGCPAYFHSIEAMKEDLFFAEVVSRQAFEGAETLQTTDT